jgi:hypothetical protein
MAPQSREDGAQLKHFEGEKSGRRRSVRPRGAPVEERLFRSREKDQDEVPLLAAAGRSGAVGGATKPVLAVILLSIEWRLL